MTGKGWGLSTDGYRVTDFNIVHSGQSDYLAKARALNRLAFQPLESVKLGNLYLLNEPSGFATET
jgi:hypothetical protein